MTWEGTPGMVKCCRCDQAVPISTTSLFVSGSGEEREERYTCDACRIEDLSTSHEELEPLVEQVEEDHGAEGLHALILRSLHLLERQHKYVTIGTIRREVVAILATEDAALHPLESGGKPTGACSLKDVLDELKTDMGIEQMNEGTELLYQLLIENSDRLDEAPLGEDEVIRILLDGVEYRVHCECDELWMAQERPMPSEDEDVYPESLVHIIYREDSKEERGISCVVTFDDDRIFVSYEVKDDEDGSSINVKYEGKDLGHGHYELHCELRDEQGNEGESRATLHRPTARNKMLEGFWEEVWDGEESRGAWQIDLVAGRICPTCGSDEVVDIVYGELPFDPDQGKTFVAGGCCLRAEKWHCKVCEAEWA